MSTDCVQIWIYRDITTTTTKHAASSAAKLQQQNQNIHRERWMHLQLSDLLFFTDFVCFFFTVCTFMGTMMIVVARLNHVFMEVHRRELPNRQIIRTPVYIFFFFVHCRLVPKLLDVYFYNINGFSIKETVIDPLYSILMILIVVSSFVCCVVFCIHTGTILCGRVFWSELKEVASRLLWR